MSSHQAEIPFSIEECGPLIQVTFEYSRRTWQKWNGAFSAMSPRAPKEA